jgi:sortase (surface protein transpeptidase)
MLYQLQWLNEIIIYMYGAVGMLGMKVIRFISPERTAKNNDNHSLYTVTLSTFEQLMNETECYCVYCE